MATLSCTRSTCLRTISTHRALVAAPFSAAFSSTSARPAKQARLQQSPRPRIASEVRQARLPPAARKASTTTSTTQAIPDNVLTWDRFFELRRTRRWINLGCSVLTSVITVGVATPLIAQADFDSWGAQISGLDPIVVLGISTFTVAAGGWLCGPSFGNLMFSLWAGRRGWRAGIAEKEKSFYARIKRYRADASASSPQNPIPDYYGEKIGSVKDYRRWLKDQRAFNLKKNKNMI
ncbi:Presequence translocated-associated motor subunit pam17, mitochondrial [Pseudocercospora fuligena]|uniref:Presequence translocated-associated motor subunit PAM17 n=1 Tax=Pseudocercospora fuligena TaxID=685502 RepID=A0A8H6RFW2_9PEZI|nr:Presequence translocated-associated motor subunit pam17, mitochondrial [Pseudocercospora fuligena]